MLWIPSARLGSKVQLKPGISASRLLGNRQKLHRIPRCSLRKLEVYAKPTQTIKPIKRKSCKKSKPPRKASTPKLTKKKSKKKLSKVRDHKRAKLKKLRTYDDATRTPRGNPLPEPLHATISPEQVVPGARVIVVGDVHGCCTELELLLSKLAFRSGTDVLILAGDLVNKGPRSADVVKLARKLKALAVRGNHDDAALAAYYIHADCGRDVPAKYEWVKDLEAEDAAYLSALPFSIALPSYNTVVVHAGLVPSTPLVDNSLYHLYTIRDVFAQAESSSPSSHANAVQAPDTVHWQAAAKDNKEAKLPWAEAWVGPPHILFGHDAARGLQLHSHATGLDTGCVYGGKLTACVLRGVLCEDEDASLADDGIPMSIGTLFSVTATEMYEVPDVPKGIFETTH